MHVILHSQLRLARAKAKGGVPEKSVQLLLRAPWPPPKGVAAADTAVFPWSALIGAKAGPAPYQPRDPKLRAVRRPRHTPLAPRAHHTRLSRGRGAPSPGAATLAARGAMWPKVAPGQRHILELLMASATRCALRSTQRSFSLKMAHAGSPTWNFELQISTLRRGSFTVSSAEPPTVATFTKEGERRSQSRKRPSA